MADYTALVEAGSSLVELLRDNLTPEPISNRELIALCSPHESENNQLTLYLYQVEEDTQGVQSGYYQVGQNTERLRPTRYNLRFLHQVLLQRKASILHEMADALHVSIDAHTDMERFCDLLHQHYAEELSWVDALPQVVYDDSCIFAHAGIMNETDFGSDFREVMTYPHFMLHAPEFTRWVIVGHMPVSEYCHDIARFHPIVDARRHIISIDGGNAVKHAGQLNALIMRDGSISWESVDELPYVRAARDIAPPNRDPLFITWRESAIRVLKHGEDADFCEHLASGRKLWIAHEFIHAGKDDQLCADDFTSYQMPLQRGEQVSLVRRYERFSIIKKDGILGWCRNADLIP